jgi:hypothetical protein
MSLSNSHFTSSVVHNNASANAMSATRASAPLWLLHGENS